METAVDMNDYFQIRIERFQNRVIYRTALKIVQFTMALRGLAKCGVFL